MNKQIRCPHVVHRQRTVAHRRLLWYRSSYLPSIHIFQSEISSRLRYDILHCDTYLPNVSRSDFILKPWVLYPMHTMAFNSLYLCFRLSWHRDWRPKIALSCCCIANVCNNRKRMPQRSEESILLLYFKQSLTRYHISVSRSRVQQVAAFDCMTYEFLC